VIHRVLVPANLGVADEEVGLLEGALGEQAAPPIERLETASHHQQAAGSIVESVKNSAPEP
jgi:hypothetical protein